MMMNEQVTTQAVEEKVSAEQPPMVSTGGGLGTAATVMLSVCLTLVALSPVGFVIYRHLPQPVGTLDPQAVIDENQRAMLSQLGATPAGMTDAQAQQAAKATGDFAKKLSTAVDQVARDCRCILVNKAALLGTGNAVDYTDDLRQKMRK
jgi:hypothetical protein